MDKTKLRSIVLFVDDIDAASSCYARLLSVNVHHDEHFKSIQLGEQTIGFHPSDEKSLNGTVVPYFETSDLQLMITNAATIGFELFRGPIRVGDEQIAQVRNAEDMRIGFVQTL